MSDQIFLKQEAVPVDKPWAGERLANLLNLVDRAVGESWVVSCHKDGPTLWNGRPLNEFMQKDELPYLIKFIDTSDHLSVQVHPGDEYAKEHENSLGKTECWVILAAQEGAGIYLGLKDGVSKDQLESGIRSNEDLSAYLKFYPVKRGDFFFVPAGSIHAIGAGVFLAEVQQSSGVTYRVWDWNRVDENGQGRELHIDKAMDVINFDTHANRPEFFKYRANLFAKKNIEVATHRDFNLFVHSLKSGESKDIEKKSERASSLVCLKGEIEISSGNEKLTLGAYEASLIRGRDLSIQLTCQNDAEVLWVS